MTVSVSAAHTWSLNRCIVSDVSDCVISSLDVFDSITHNSVANNFQSLQFSDRSISDCL